MWLLAGRRVYWAIRGLNTRESAIVVWTAILLGFLLAKPDVRRSFLQRGATLFGSVWLIGPIVVAGVYMLAVVWTLAHAGYWASTMLKLTVVWFAGGALVALFNARDVDFSYYRRLVLRNAGLVVVVEFVTNLHTFPLPIELLFVPLATLLVMTQVVAEASPEYAAAKKPLGVLLGLLGLASLSLSLSYVADNFARVATAENVEALALPLVLTGCFVPFLVAMRYLTVWQTTLHMVRSGLGANAGLFRFARREIIRACGVSLWRAQLFESSFRGRLWGAETEGDVARVIDDFRAAWAKGDRCVPL